MNKAQLILDLLEYKTKTSLKGLRRGDHRLSDIVASVLKYWWESNKSDKTITPLIRIPDKKVTIDSKVGPIDIVPGDFIVEIPGGDDLSVKVANVISKPFGDAGYKLDATYITGIHRFQHWKKK